MDAKNNFGIPGGSEPTTIVCTSAAAGAGTGTGFASILRFGVTPVLHTGSGIHHMNSTAVGTILQIREPGYYSMTFSTGDSSGGPYVIAKNVFNYTTLAADLSLPLAYSEADGTHRLTMSAMDYLVPGDQIAVVYGPGVTPANSIFRVIKAGKPA